MTLPSRRPSRSPFTEPVSPELVLVDPLLAAEARALLPDRPWPEPAPLGGGASPAASERAPAARGDGDAGAGFAEAAPERLETPAAERPLGRRRRRIAVPAVVLAATGAAVAALALDLVPSPEDDPVLVPVTSRGATVQRVLSPTEARAATRPARASESRPRPAADPETATGGERPAAAQRRQTTRPTLPASVPRTFVWPEAPRASAYEFHLYRGSRLIFRTRTAAARLEMPNTWKHAGSKQSLEPGSYTWYVWPVRGKRGPAARALVQAELVVSASG